MDVWRQGVRAAIKWEQIRRENHFLDAGYLATAAGEFIRAMGGAVPTDAPRPRKTLAQMAGKA